MVLAQMANVPKGDPAINPFFGITHNEVTP